MQQPAVSNCLKASCEKGRAMCSDPAIINGTSSIQERT